MKVNVRHLAITSLIAMVLSTSMACPATAASMFHATNGVWDFSIKVRSSPVVIYGTRIPFFFSTKKPLSGSCSIYRWEADSAWTHTYIGRTKLIKGKGKGYVTWEWDSQEVNPILNLQVFCKSRGFYGSGYKVVTGAWGTD
jgi:hypothetical protein